MARQILPVAGGAAVRRHGMILVRRHRWPLLTTLGLYALAAIAGLVAPRLLGDLVEGVRNGTTRAAVDQIALAIAGFLVVQSILIRFASFSGGRLSERVLADVREDFVERVLDLPLSTVERAGDGDLLTRTTRDVDALGYGTRYAVPQLVIAVVTVLLTGVALVLAAPLLALPSLLAVPGLVLGARWYVRRAPAGYLRENAAFSDITDGLTETVEGARTVEALRLTAQRIARTDRDIATSYAAERYTLFLRTVWFPLCELSYVIPVAATLLLGGWFTLQGWVTVGELTAAVLYVQQLIGPLDKILSWLDEIQVGSASLARLLGVSQVPDDRVPTGARPAGEDLRAEDVRYSYVDGRDVLHGVDLDLRPGERLAMVGPSGAGKSTLGRLLAGVHGPRTGRVTVGGVPLVDLPLRDLRREVCLVTQEHHVFRGTLRENMALARLDATDEEIRRALAAVGWSFEVDLDATLGGTALRLSPAQAQQLALARLVLADPHTLVLDEATSLLDPRAARHLERSLGRVLEGRTVVAIAHRLFSAHDADRVAVVEDGRITELGSHDELVAAGGAYAALWHSWHGDPAPTDDLAPTDPALPDRGQEVPMLATVAAVSLASSAPASSISSPRRPADT
jgi:ABC-type multidrug transport system fused ATPase/permease subunit